jgi:hypothetical protein
MSGDFRICREEPGWLFVINGPVYFSVELYVLEPRPRPLTDKYLLFAVAVKGFLIDLD